jgi:hypothetical protein
MQNNINKTPDDLVKALTNPEPGQGSILREPLPSEEAEARARIGRLISVNASGHLTDIIPGWRDATKRNRIHLQ